MFYYDETGDIQHTRNRERARRHNVRSLIVSGSYPLAPEAAGRLQELLGPLPTKATEDEARRRVRQVLEQIGLGEVPVEATLEALPKEWKLAVDVGE